MLVEDDDVLCEAVRIGLERQGYHVESFLDPIAAQTAFEQAPSTWDLVITDQNMPNLTGLQLIKMIRSARCDIPVILWTAMHHSFSEEAARAEGATLYLGKPVENGTLGEAIRNILSGKI